MYSIAEPQADPSLTPETDSALAEPVYDASYWRPRLENAVKASESYEKPADARYRQAVGPYFKDGWTGAEDTHGNWYFKFVMDMTPALTSGDLAVTAGAADPDAVGAHADALEKWLNRAIKETAMIDELAQVCESMLWGPGGVLMIYPEDVPGSTSARMASLGVQAPIVRCRIRSVDRNLCFVDPDREINEGEFQGHREVLSRADILADAEGTTDAGGWDLDAVDRIMRRDDSVGDVRRTAAKVFNDGVCKANVKNDQMVVYRVWCRRTQMIHTMAYAQQEGEARGEELRKPVRWRGHPRGPYVWFGIMWVRGHPYPLSLTALAERLVRKSDAHREKADADAKAAKRNIATLDKNAAKQYQKLKNGEVWVNDPAAIKDIETGGVQEATADYIAYTDGQLEELFGLSPARMGDTSSGPATNTVVAENALAGKKKLFAFRWRTCVREAVKRMAFIGWNLDQVEARVPMPDPTTGRMVSYTFYGGVMEGEKADWMQVENEIDLEPYSLEATDSATMQATMAMVGKILLDFTNMVVTNPLAAVFVKWENWLDDQMKAANVRGGAKRYLNMPAVKAFLMSRMQSMMMGLGAGGIPGSAGPSPGPLATGQAGMGAPGGGGMPPETNPMAAAQSIGSSAGGLARGAAYAGGAGA